eukprot:GSChrysophyteH1.ASY1.ANO1.2133.1 assembled CDS
MLETWKGRAHLKSTLSTQKRFLEVEFYSGWYCDKVMKSCVLTLTLLVLLEVASCDLALLPRGAHAFMYLWYGEPDTDGVYKHWNHDILPHWEERVNKAYPNVGKRFNPPHDIHSPFYPLHGPYSSQNPAVIKRQFDELLSAGIEVAVVSWWGQRDKPYAADTQGVNTDIMMAKLLQEADNKGIKIAFHLEPYPSRSISSINEDLKYISDNYGHHECLYRGTDGRIVYYVYDSYHIAPIQWARLLSSDGDLSVRGGPADGIFFGLWLQHFHGRDLKNGYFDGFYTYFGTDGFSYGSTSSNWRSMCQFARLQPPLICGLSVGPGYNDSLIRPWNTHNERSRANGKYYEHMWKHAIKANPTIISITSYNEWGEGTQIEPASASTPDGRRKLRLYEDYGSAGPFSYLRSTKKYISEFLKVEENVSGKNRNEL